MTLSTKGLKVGVMFNVVPMTPGIGAEIEGVNLATAGDKDIERIHESLLEWKVVFFRDQGIEPAEQVAFARRFGELEVHPVAPHVDGVPEAMILEHGPDEPRPDGYGENVWHSDVSWREVPSAYSILRAVEVPDVGGDTLWADMAAAYDALSDGLRSQLDGLFAVHDFMTAFGRHIPAERFSEMRLAFPPAVHPVVRTHPESGRRLLYVNDSFTTQVVGLDRLESRELLATLSRHVARPEFQCRFRWRPGSVAMWDNRITQHYAVKDYWPGRRVMHRVTVVGDRPV